MAIMSGVEAQEARGQKDFVAAETLPIKSNGSKGEDVQAQLETLGAIYGKKVDDLFVNVHLPNGWKKQATDHAMWSNLLDEKGRERASIFYKAACYDRDAFMGLSLFFRIEMICLDASGNETKHGDHENEQYFVENANGALLYLGASFKRGDNEARDKCRKDCGAYLNAEWPEWQNPLAYWT